MAAGSTAAKRSASRSQRMSAVLSEPQRPSPILSALQFQHATNTIPTPEQSAQGMPQGASLDIHSGRLLQAGIADKWMVGGHIANGGATIPEVAISRPERGITFRESLDHVQNVTAQTRGQGKAVAAGSWYSDEKDHIALDASTSTSNRKTARKLMHRRDEDETFNLKTGTTMVNERKATRVAAEKTAAA